VARLGTCGEDQEPHLVPVTFAVVGEVVVVAVDDKPKTTTNLRRLRNIEENPHVAFLADRYEEDWSRLWWVRADARASVVRAGAQWVRAVDLLVAKYPQYGARRPAGPVIWAEVARWSGWSSSE